MLVASLSVYIFFPHPAWPLVHGTLLVSKRRSPAPDDLLTFVRPLCRPVGDPETPGLQGSTGFVVGDISFGVYMWVFVGGSCRSLP